MSVRVWFVALIIHMAFSILIFLMYSPSVHPKYRVKFLEIVMGCTLIIRAICFKEKFVDQFIGQPWKKFVQKNGSLVSESHY